jgi:hypothetical protein
MSRPIISFYDMATDETTEREMNDAEFAAYEIELELQAQAQAEAEAKATAKAALLAQLGITEEQAKLLLS